MKTVWFILLIIVPFSYSIQAEYKYTSDLVKVVPMDKIVLHAAQSLLKIYSEYRFIRLKRQYISVQDSPIVSVTEVARVFADIYVRDVDGLEFINNYSIDILFSKDGGHRFSPQMFISYSLEFYTNSLVKQHVDYKNSFKIDIFDLQRMQSRFFNLFKRSTQKVLEAQGYIYHSWRKEVFNIIIPQTKQQVTSFWVEFLKVNGGESVPDEQYPLYVYSHFIRFDIYINKETHEKSIKKTVIKGNLKGIGLIKLDQNIEQNKLIQYDE